MPGGEQRPRLIGRGLFNKVDGLFGLRINLPLAGREIDLFAGKLVKIVAVVKIQMDVVGQEDIVKPIAIRAGGNRAAAIAVKVPLADIAHIVSLIAEDFPEIVPVTGQHLNVVVVRPVFERVLATEQHAAERRADRGRGNAIIEAHAFPRQQVEVGRVQLRVAGASEHIERLLVGEDHQQVRGNILIRTFGGGGVEQIKGRDLERACRALSHQSGVACRRAGNRRTHPVSRRGVGCHADIIRPVRAHVQLGAGDYVGRIVKARAFNGKVVDVHH